MKDSMVLTLAQLGTFRLIGVKFTPSSRTYFYKSRDYSIEVDDQIIVSTPTRTDFSHEYQEKHEFINGMQVVTVVEVQDSPDIDPDQDWSYKWVVQKVDRTAHERQEQLEMDAINEMRRIRRERARLQARDWIQNEMFGGQMPSIEQAPAFNKLMNETRNEKTDSSSS